MKTAKKKNRRVKMHCRGCARFVLIPSVLWRVCRLKRTEPACPRCGDECRFVKVVK